MSGERPDVSSEHHDVNGERPDAGGERHAVNSEEHTRREHRQWTPLARALAAAGNQWALLIVVALGSGPLRLNDLRRHLPGISTGVLNRHLQHLVDLEILSRRRFRELPPRVEYRLTPCGTDLLPIIGELARWGMRYMWSEPLHRETVDIGALMRLLPLLVDVSQLSEGVIEMVIELPDGPDQHLFDIADGALAAIEPGAMLPWACVSGAPDAWVGALGPDGDRRALKITGDAKLAECLLDALPR